MTIVCAPRSFFPSAVDNDAVNLAHCRRGRVSVIVTSESCQGPDVNGLETQTISNGGDAGYARAARIDEGPRALGYTTSSERRRGKRR